jgi:hypothetical protein
LEAFHAGAYTKQPVGVKRDRLGMRPRFRLSTADKTARRN